MRKLIITFACVLLVLFGFFVGRTIYHMQSVKAINIDMKGVAIQAEAEKQKFMGIRHAKTNELLAVYPELKEKPIMVSFSSKYCLDCKKMKPIVNNIVENRHDFHFHVYDIMQDAKKFPLVFKTFKPVSVPTLIFISQSGEIEDVLYNQQSSEVIENTLDHLITASVQAQEDSEATSP